MRMVSYLQSASVVITFGDPALYDVQATYTIFVYSEIFSLSLGIVS